MLFSTHCSSCPFARDALPRSPMPSPLLPPVRSHCHLLQGASPDYRNQHSNLPPCSNSHPLFLLGFLSFFFSFFIALVAQSRTRLKQLSSSSRPVSQHCLLKRLSFLHCIFLPPLLKIRCPYEHGFISGFSILFH